MSWMIWRDSAFDFGRADSDGGWTPSSRYAGWSAPTTPPAAFVRSLLWATANSPSGLYMVPEPAEGTRLEQDLEPASE